MDSLWRSILKANTSRAGTQMKNGKSCLMKIAFYLGHHVSETECSEQSRPCAGSQLPHDFAMLIQPTWPLLRAPLQRAQPHSIQRPMFVHLFFFQLLVDQNTILETEGPRHLLGRCSSGGGGVFTRYLWCKRIPWSQFVRGGSGCYGRPTPPAFSQRFCDAAQQHGTTALAIICCAIALWRWRHVRDGS